MRPDDRTIIVSHRESLRSLNRPLNPLAPYLSPFPVRVCNQFIKRNHRPSVVMMWLTVMVIVPVYDPLCVRFFFLVAVVVYVLSLLFAELAEPVPEGPLFPGLHP